MESKIGDKNRSKENLKEFGNQNNRCREDIVEPDLSESRYYEMVLPEPVCNHTVEIADENIGYTRGVLCDGIPFEAELWTDRTEINMSVYWTVTGNFRCNGEVINDKKSISGQDYVINKIIAYKYEKECYLNSALIIGMVDYGFSDNQEEIENCVQYLENMGIIVFTTDMRNGAVQYLTDCEGNNIIGVIICLENEIGKQAKTNLHFRDFPNRLKTAKFRIVK